MTGGALLIVSTNLVYDELVSAPDSYKVVGKEIPFRHDNPIVCLAEITIGESRIQIDLKDGENSVASVDFEIWEHGVHELEVLSQTLREAALAPFPPSIEIGRPQSRIGIKVGLRSAIWGEIGLSVKHPMADRVGWFCYSRDWGKPGHPELGVSLSIAIAGKYREIVFGPDVAVEFADWLDRHILVLEDLTMS